MMRMTKRWLCPSLPSAHPITLRGVPFCHPLAEQLVQSQAALAPLDESLLGEEANELGRVWLSRRECAVLDLLAGNELPPTSIIDSATGCTHQFFNVARHFPHVTALADLQMKLALHDAKQLEIKEEGDGFRLRSARSGTVFEGGIGKFLGKEASLKRYKNPYWSSRPGLIAFQTDVLPGEVGITFGTFEMFNAEQTENPERFTRENCKPYEPCSIFGDLYMPIVARPLQGHIIANNIPRERFWIRESMARKYGAKLADDAIPIFIPTSYDEPLALYNIGQCHSPNDVKRLRDLGNENLKAKLKKAAGRYKAFLEEMKRKEGGSGDNGGGDAQVAGDSPTCATHAEAAEDLSYLSVARD